MKFELVAAILFLYLIGSSKIMGMRERRGKHPEQQYRSRNTAFRPTRQQTRFGGDHPKELETKYSLHLPGAANQPQSGGEDADAANYIGSLVVAGVVARLEADSAMAETLEKQGYISDPALLPKKG